jgi:hypothetical protein
MGDDSLTWTETLGAIQSMIGDHILVHVVGRNAGTAAMARGGLGGDAAPMIAGGPAITQKPPGS